MVSLDSLSTYCVPLRANPFTNFFLDFLNNVNELSAPVLDPSDTDNVVCNLLIYLRKNDKDSATSLYQRLVNRQIRSDTDWVHNDYFLFTLVCTVRKFHLDNHWVKEIVRARNDSGHEQRLINKSFENLLAGNYSVHEDYHQISVVFQSIIGDAQFDETNLNRMFASLWQKTFPYYESDFLNIISLRSIQAAFEAKGLLNTSQRFVVEHFASHFIARVKLITKVITYSLFALVVGGLAVSAAFFTNNASVKVALGILSALGLGASFFADARKWMATHIENYIKQLWGYKP